MSVSPASPVEQAAEVLLAALDRMHAQSSLSLSVRFARDRLREVIALAAAARAEREMSAA